MTTKTQKNEYPDQGILMTMSRFWHNIRKLQYISFINFKVKITLKRGGARGTRDVNKTFKAVNHFTNNQQTKHSKNSIKKQSFNKSTSASTQFIVSVNLIFNDPV